LQGLDTFQRAESAPWSLERASIGDRQHCEIKHEGALMAITTANQPPMKLYLGRAISHTSGDQRVEWHTSLWEHTAWVTTVRRGSSRPGLTTRRYMDGEEMVLVVRNPTLTLTPTPTPALAPTLTLALALTLTQVSVRPGSTARGDLSGMDDQQLTDFPTVVRRCDTVHVAPPPHYLTVHVLRFHV